MLLLLLLVFFLVVMVDMVALVVVDIVAVVGVDLLSSKPPSLNRLLRRTFKARPGSLISLMIRRSSRGS